MARTLVTGIFLSGSLLEGGSYCGGDFGSVEVCYGLRVYGGGEFVSGELVIGQYAGGQLLGTFVRGIGLTPSCQCFICLFIAFLPQQPRRPAGSIDTGSY